MATTATLPLPPGAVEPVRVPVPERCYRCRGVNADACERCRGCGFEAARFDLSPSRTHGLRRVRFEPSPDGMHRLYIALAKSKSHAMKWTEYSVVETANQWGGRSFLVAKVGTPRCHNVYLGKGECRCDCEGDTYQSAHKANQRAHEAGAETFPTLGCRHLDVLHALLGAGWLDLDAKEQS